ncbi:hypothetical protein [Spirosoma harenae]
MEILTEPVRYNMKTEVHRLTSEAELDSLILKDYNTVNQSGEVIRARYRLGVDSPAEWSDKVFEPGYSLQSLPEVETYIKKTGHLSNVPSAEEMTKKGIDWAKYNAVVMAKIEELTLYTSKQHKRVQKL